MLILITYQTLFFGGGRGTEAETVLSNTFFQTTSVKNIDTEVTNTFVIAQLVCGIGIAKNVSSL